MTALTGARNGDLGIPLLDLHVTIHSREQLRFQVFYALLPSKQFTTEIGFSLKKLNGSSEAPSARFIPAIIQLVGALLAFSTE